jgi:hypothetical protein
LFLLRNGWRDRMACQAALALTIYFAGTSIRSGLNWGQYIAANRGIDAPIFDDVYLVVVLAVGLSVIGAGLCIYSFVLGKYRAVVTWRPPRSRSWCRCACIGNSEGKPKAIISFQSGDCGAPDCASHLRAISCGLSPPDAAHGSADPGRRDG